MNPIIIRSQLTEKDYLSSLFYLFYRKSTAYITLGIGVIMLLSVVLSIADENEFPYFNLIIGLVCIIGIPLLIYWTSKANYKSDKRIKEGTIYTFDENGYAVQGESFETKMSWDKIHKVKETKAYVFIFQTKHIANIVPKRAFDTDQLSAFRKLVRALKGTKKTQ